MGVRAATSVTAVNAGPERTLLAGGYRNQVWKVRAGRGWVIEKRYAEDPGEPNPMYPNLPDHEAAALGLLGPHGWSPRLVSHQPGVVTYQFVSGPGWRARARARDGGVAEVAELLGNIHALPAPRAMRLLCGSAAEACAHGDVMVDAVPVRAGAALRAVRPTDPSDLPVRRRSLVHTDCGPGNLVRSRCGLLLIDWQCPGRGDAAEDIACFLSPAMMTLYQQQPHPPATHDAFLAAYPDRAAVARYHRDALAWHYRIGAYCVWRAHRLARRQPEIAERYRCAFAAEIEYMRGLS